MRAVKSAWLVLPLTLALTAPAVAGEWIIGAKTGQMMINDSAVSSDPTNAGVMVGWQQGVGLGELGVEGEFTKTISDGEFLGLDVSVDTMAIYAAFRTAGPFYFKVKGGYLTEDVKIGSVSDSDSGMSYGVGLGFGIGILQLELEYTQVESDIAFVSVGVQF